MIFQLQVKSITYFGFNNKNEDFPGGPVVKNLPVNTGDTGSIPGLGRFHTLWDS